jgi:hypothetical protein
LASACRKWSVAQGAVPQFQHTLIRPLLCTLVDMNFAEFSFHALGCIMDILRKNGLHDWIGALA